MDPKLDSCTALDVWGKWSICLNPVMDYEYSNIYIRIVDFSKSVMLIEHSRLIIHLHKSRDCTSRSWIFANAKRWANPPVIQVTEPYMISSGVRMWCYLNIEYNDQPEQWSDRNRLAEFYDLLKVLDHTHIVDTRGLHHLCNTWQSRGATRNLVLFSNTPNYIQQNQQTRAWYCYISTNAPHGPCVDVLFR